MHGTAPAAARCAVERSGENLCTGGAIWGDIVKWCGENLRELSHLALDRSNWQKMVKQASDINGH